MPNRGQLSRSVYNGTFSIREIMMFLQPLRAVRTLTTPYVGFGVDLGPAPCTQRVVVGTLGKPKMVHRSKFERRLRVALGPKAPKGTLWGYSEVITNGWQLRLDNTQYLATGMVP